MVLTRNWTFVAGRSLFGSGATNRCPSPNITIAAVRRGSADSRQERPLNLKARGRAGTVCRPQTQGGSARQGKMSDQPAADAVFQTCISKTEMVLVGLHRFSPLLGG